MVKRVGKDLSIAVTRFMSQNKSYAKRIEGYNWEFNLVMDNTPNAWCMPGGKVVVYSGILPYTQSNTGMAVVLGHEIAHVLARHGNERMSWALLVELGGQTLSAAMSQRPGWTSNLLLASYGAGSQVGVILPHSRLQESEAELKRLGVENEHLRTLLEAAERA